VTGVDDRLRADRYSEAKLRTVEAAFQLFAEHGVAGTSLQMIADALGVTKAAVYHQFRTKEAIVIAVAEVELVPLQAAVEAAEAEGHSTAAREKLLDHLIDTAVTHRRWAVALQGDPTMTRVLSEHPPFVNLLTRLYSVLIDEDAGSTVAVRTAMLAAAVGAAVAHPLVSDIDDETLRAELLAITRRLFDL